MWNGRWPTTWSPGTGSCPCTTMTVMPRKCPSRRYWRRTWRRGVRPAVQIRDNVSWANVSAIVASAETIVVRVSRVLILFEACLKGGLFLTKKMRFYCVKVRMTSHTLSENTEVPFSHYQFSALRHSILITWSPLMLFNLFSSSNHVMKPNNIIFTSELYKEESLPYSK